MSSDSMADWRSRMILKALIRGLKMIVSLLEKIDKGQPV